VTKPAIDGFGNGFEGSAPERGGDIDVGDGGGGTGHDDQSGIIEDVNAEESAEDAGEDDAAGEVVRESHCGLVELPRGGARYARAAAVAFAALNLGTFDRLSGAADAGCKARL